MNAHFTPGPWDYVPSNEHHGPYVTSEFGSTICDCYVMSNPSALSVRNGGTSKPIHHLHEMADANARLIAAAPEMLAALRELTSYLHDAGNLKTDLTWPDSFSALIAAGDAALAKAEGK